MQGSMSLWRESLLLWRPSGRAEIVSNEGWPSLSQSCRGRFGNPILMSFCIVRVLENDLVAAGISGNGFSRELIGAVAPAAAVVPSEFFLVRDKRGWDLAIRRRIRGPFGKEGKFDSDSSLEGVRGGVGRNDVWSLMDIWRRRETETLASAAISLAISEERGVVLKTTK